MTSDGPQTPFVFRKCLLNWKTFQRWSPEYIAQSTANHHVKFKIGKRHQYRENTQKYHDIEITETFQNFVDWCKGVGKSGFSEFDMNNDWAYCCYEYVNELFHSWPALIDDIDWTFFGLPEQMKRRSVFWMGSLGSFTDCHYDTYGCNLVCQIRGNKQWILFPPWNTKYLYATRIPYEESSVYSSVDFNNPDTNRFPQLQKATPFMVTLAPGDALFVPRHWWHFVKTVDGGDCHDDRCSLSINLWLDDPAVDNEQRIFECLSKLVTFAFLDSSFLPSLPTGAIVDGREEFLDGEWGGSTVGRLNELFDDSEHSHERGVVTLKGVFDGFDGEKVAEVQWGAAFPSGGNGGLSTQKNVSPLDIIDCFSHPDVIAAVQKVLSEKRADWSNIGDE